jgi:hypothetical protein
MKDSGKGLERLVQEIEKKLLPEGFKVSVNERLFDAGVQIAEFDILITGNLGSTSIKWLIECRDRPSEGPAPGEWIEQLVGRRGRFKLDKVTAVSTTGFAKKAREYAKDEGIECRSVDSLAPESIAHWFLPTHLDVIEHRGNLLHASLVVDKQTTENVAKLLKAKLANFSAQMPIAKAPILVHTETGQELTINDAWSSILAQNKQLFEGLEPNGKTKPLTLQVNYTNPQSHYQIMTDEGPAHVIQITFRAELSIVHSEVAASEITQYSQALEKQAIAQSIRFAMEVGEQAIDLTFHNLGDEDKTFVVMHTSSPDRA